MGSRIVSVKYALPERYSKQNNNPEEEILRAAYDEIAKKHGIHFNAAASFEFCGPTAFINGYDATHRKPAEAVINGKAAIQSESALSILFRSPEYYKLYKDVAYVGYDPAKVPANRVLACYPVATRYLFDASCAVIPKPDKKELMTLLAANKAIQIQLIMPGHFVCITGYDADLDQIIFNDPHDGRSGQRGFARRMGFTEYMKNTQPCVLRIDGD